MLEAREAQRSFPALRAPRGMDIAPAHTWKAEVSERVLVSVQGGSGGTDRTLLISTNSSTSGLLLLHCVTC